jgi:large subunit ribosomal protein L24e
MKRNPRKVKWTKVYRALQGKDLCNDTVFQFERRRNRPLKYNREILHSTLRALGKLDVILTRRTNRFFENRMTEEHEICARQATDGAEYWTYS